MEKSIEINMLNSLNSYDVLYPKTLGNLVSGIVSKANEATKAIKATEADKALESNRANESTTAEKLKTARYFQTNLSVNSTVSFDGTDNCYAGVSGILQTTFGGTGVSVSDTEQLASYFSKECVKVVSYTGTGGSSLTINFNSANLNNNRILGLYIMPDTASSFTTAGNTVYAPFLFPFVYNSTRQIGLHDSMGLGQLPNAGTWTSYGMRWSNMSSYNIHILNYSGTTYYAIGFFGVR